MPPVRTISTAKPVKTERTHEENQERAYIAASRRSDRSLEARIESARRASEIHKKRTGRALRVTEQDVVNEEMYEEEDDDLPAQYRRLTAHLQTNSADFNRKLHAYLATHQAGRQALFDQSFMGGFGHTYPNAPHFAPQMMMHQPPYQQQMLPPQMIHRSPQSFRQAPYPSPQQQSNFTFNHLDSSAAHMSYSPFSMALPTETQQMLGSTLDPNDPYTSLYMQNSETAPQPFYSYNPNLPAKARVQQNSQGMNQTLAPSSGPLTDINPQNLSYNTADFKPSSMSRQTSQQGSSGLITPGAEWSKFIDGTLFEEMPASQ
ncbi:hypothetical protein UCDDS831_g05002 [Diplodia seriata]|uniref:Uncharacterized protein n=1 Tax=Diplodia seriata TaxID=420778 RepID=A0A0G2ED50_9PEZI|nr:hypothetical protein UCDDS831_g05002 [Diplodia seriata]